VTLEASRIIAAVVERSGPALGGGYLVDPGAVGGMLVPQPGRAVGVQAGRRALTARIKRFGEYSTHEASNPTRTTRSSASTSPCCATGI
jgi:hypothetical protein